jgi:hypothetical protein
MSDQNRELIDISKFDIIIEWNQPKEDKPDFCICEEYYNEHMKKTRLVNVSMLRIYL